MTPLTFDALIALSGSGSSRDLFTRWAAERSHLLVAADGGTDLLLEQALVPDLVAGDFDSIKPSSLEALPETTVLFKVPRDKDFTDGELATAAAVLMSFDEDIQQFTDKEGHSLYQAFEACSDLSTKTYLFAYYRGDRVDHQLANLALARLLVKRGAEVFPTDGKTLARMVQGPTELNPVFPPDCFEPVRTG
ncbi:MAG: thiamine diphosphokinase, partial [Clostridiaceae bacterium]|nr:thiamine diphosphokinase [Clostridiaceae bacterium]